MQQPEHLPREGDRRELLRMLDRLTPGDVVIVAPIDGLARSTLDLFAIVKRIVDAGGQFRSLAEPWADTGSSTGRLMIAVLGRRRVIPGALLPVGGLDGADRPTINLSPLGRLRRHHRNPLLAREAGW